MIKVFLTILLSAILILGATSCNLIQDDPNENNLIEAPIYRITGVSVQPIERRQEGTQTIDYYSDTLKTRLQFEVVTEAEVIGSTLVERPACPSGADCIFPAEIVNPTVEGQGWLRFNGPIRYMGRWLEEGMNLLDDEALVQAFDGSHLDLLFPPRIVPYAIPHVTMQPEAFEIVPGWYEIEFGWGTEEGEMFADTVRVFIAL